MRLPIFFCFPREIVGFLFQCKELPSNPYYILAGKEPAIDLYHILAYLYNFATKRHARDLILLLHFCSKGKLLPKVVVEASNPLITRKQKTHIYTLGNEKKEILPSVLSTWLSGLFTDIVSQTLLLLLPVVSRQT